MEKVITVQLMSIMHKKIKLYIASQINTVQLQMFKLKIRLNHKHRQCFPNNTIRL